MGEVLSFWKQECLRVTLGRCTPFVTTLLCTGETEHFKGSHPYITLTHTLTHTPGCLCTFLSFFHIGCTKYVWQMFGLMYCKGLIMGLINMFLVDGLCHTLTLNVLQFCFINYSKSSSIFSSSVCFPFPPCH